MSPHDGEGSPTASDARRLLLVEDHADSARAFQRLLERHGFVVEVAADVKGAMWLAMSGSFDLILCDIRLPDGNGVDLLRMLHGHFGLKSLEAVCISAAGGSDDADRALEAGFSAHISKPVVIEDLLGVI